MHPKVKPYWQLPEPPGVGYDTPVAVHYPDGDVELDFLNKDKAMYASDDGSLPVIEIVWPWAEGYKPTNADWIEIGFEPHH